MLHDNYLCLVESDKHQIEEVRSKIQAETSETKATPKRIWSRHMHSASAAFSWQEDKNAEIKSICIHSGVATGEGLGVTTPLHWASNDVIHTYFSDIYFEVLDTLSLIIWFCNWYNNKNYVALFPETCSLPFCLWSNNTILLAGQSHSCNLIATALSPSDLS